MKSLMAATAALLFLAALAIPAQAKGKIITCDQHGCSDWVGHKAVRSAKTARYDTTRKAKITHQRASNEAVLIDKPQEYVKPSFPTEKLITREEHERSSGVCRNNRGSTSLARVVEPLKSKAAEIVRECGAYIVSTDCRGGATPNHRQGKAVDIAMRGRANPACIYAHLKGWPGGVSTDYWTAPGTKHVHFSYNRRHEWGLRFSHSHKHRHSRIASR